MKFTFFIAETFFFCIFLVKKKQGNVKNFSKLIVRKGFCQTRKKKETDI